MTPPGRSRVNSRNTKDFESVQTVLDFCAWTHNTRLVNIRRYIPTVSVYFIAVGGVFLLIFMAHVERQGYLLMQGQLMEMQHELKSVAVVRTGVESGGAGGATYTGALNTHIMSARRIFSRIRDNAYWSHDPNGVQLLSGLSTELGSLLVLVTNEPNQSHERMRAHLASAQVGVVELMLLINRRAEEANRTFSNSLVAGVAMVLLLPLGAYVQRNRTLRLKKERDLAVEESSLRKTVARTERTALAREIHDGPAQFLARATLDIDLLTASVEDKKLARRLATIRGFVHDGLDTMRDIMINLRVSEMPTETMDAALEQLVHRAGRMFGDIGFRFSQTASWPSEYSPELNYQLYTIVGEALNNAGRHSKGSECHVELTTRAGDMCIVVRDNGQGMNTLLDPQNQTGDGLIPEPIPQGERFGIHGMRERARLAGVQLRWSAAEGGGTVLAICRDAKRTP